MKTSVWLMSCAAAVLLSHDPILNAGEKSGWVSLFNGKDLDGWDTWLGKPKKDEPPVGLRSSANDAFPHDLLQSLLDHVSGESGR